MADTESSEQISREEDTKSKELSAYVPENTALESTTDLAEHHEVVFFRGPRFWLIITT
jgi:hypothetical protein